MKLGRPTKYDPKYVQKILDFFTVEHTVMKPKQIWTKNGVETIEEEVANSLPTFEGFAADNLITRQTLHNWCDNHPDFLDAYNVCKEKQKRMLMDLGMRGLYNPAFTIFTAKNITDMKDKTETDVTTGGEKLSAGIFVNGGLKDDNPQ